MPTETRDRRFNMVMSEREHTLLSDLADARGLSASDIVRVLIREAHRAEFGAEQKSARATKGRK